MAVAVTAVAVAGVAVFNSISKQLLIKTTTAPPAADKNSKNSNCYSSNSNSHGIKVDLRSVVAWFRKFN